MSRLACLLACAALAAGCSTKAPLESRVFPVAEWPFQDGGDPYYLLAPGDQIEIVVHTAPELSRQVTVGPDGRVRMPFSGPVSVAGRSLESTQVAMRTALSSELKDPDLDVLLVGTPSQQIFVGGEVANPGLIELPGAIDPLQAVIMAGGITDEGRASTVVLMRRMPGGEVKSAVFDLKSGVYDPRLAEWTALRRFDVVYVTRKPIADENLFIRQYVLQALPLDISFFYNLRDDSR